MSTVRLGTRGSALALTQSGLVARMLEQAAALAGQELHVELVPVRTRGDVRPHGTVPARWGRGLRYRTA